MAEIDPQKFGEVIAELRHLRTDIKDLKDDFESLQATVGTLMESHHQRNGVKITLYSVVSVLSFLIGNVVEWLIFRGPGHPG